MAGMHNEMTADGISPLPFTFERLAIPLLKGVI